MPDAIATLIRFFNQAAAHVSAPVKLDRGLTVGGFRPVSIAALSLVVLMSGCDRSAGTQTPPWQAELAHFHHSPQITPESVSQLGVAWEFDDFVVRGRTHRGVEATPIVVGRTMYLTGPWSVVYAVDAITGKSLWTFDPDVDGQTVRGACCDAINRGLAIADDTAFVGTLDGRLIALDVKTGKPRWTTDTIIDRTRSYTISGAPRIAGANVIIGNGGADMGVRGYVSAYDRRSGALRWRFFTVPGDPKRPDEHPELTAARKTWDPKSRWDLGGGGTVWDSIVYDPDTNLVYLGTGNGGPHPSWVRSPKGGDNLYLASILAVDATSGRLKWHYQTTPNESWDYTATQNMILTDIEVGGRVRKVLLQAPKNGFFYVLDRATGELLSADKYTLATWAERIDLKTGRPVMRAQGDYSKSAKLVWPSQAGGHNWQPMAYSPRTKLVYIPVLEAPMVYATSVHPYQRFSYNNAADASFPPVPGKGDTPSRDPALRGQPTPTYRSVLKAWNPVTRTLAWASAPMSYWSGGVMVTDNGVVIQGSSDGRLSFYDARSGQVLRRINIGTGMMSAPMTYTIDGVQYLAVNAGFGGADLAAYEPGSAALVHQNFERLLVFKIGGDTVRLPPGTSVPAFALAPNQYRGDASAVARGGWLFARNCAVCHGGRDTIGGYPNLWKLPPETHAAFQQIVHEGALSYAGMASFKDVLTERDVTDIHAYISEPASDGRAAKSVVKPTQ